jgi:hypothetical protein
LRNIDFLESAKKGQLTFVIFHILGSSIGSLSEVDDLLGFSRDFKYFLVKNFINDASFFEWDPKTHSSYLKSSEAVEITIPKLKERAYEEVEVASVPFSSFISNKDRNGEPASYSFVLRGYVRHWLGQVWEEYERIKLKDIVANVGTAASRPRPQVVKVAEASRK